MEKTVFPPSGKNLSTLQRANHYTTPPLQRNFFLHLLVQMQTHLYGDENRTMPL